MRGHRQYRTRASPCPLSLPSLAPFAGGCCVAGGARWRYFRRPLRHCLPARGPWRRHRCGTGGPGRAAGRRAGPRSPRLAVRAGLADRLGGAGYGSGIRGQGSVHSGCGRLRSHRPPGPGHSPERRPVGLGTGRGARSRGCGAERTSRAQGALLGRSRGGDPRRIGRRHALGVSGGPAVRAALHFSSGLTLSTTCSVCSNKKEKKAAAAAAAAAAL